MNRHRLGAIALALWLLSALYIVPADQQAVVTRFGAVIEPRVLPGIHLSLPWPIDRIIKLKVQQMQRLVIGGSDADSPLGRTQPLQTQFLTGDQNIIQLRAVAQYFVAQPAAYLFQTENIERLIAAAVDAELTRRLAGRHVDAILTTEKTAIQEEARGAAQARLNAYSAGVQLSSVNIESVTPPPEAASAFRDVASARADTDRIIREAEGYASSAVPQARGEAQRLLEEAAAYKQRKINESLGDTERFNQVAAEYAKASQVNGARLYLETLEQVLPRIKKLIVDKNGNVDLTILRRGDPAAQR
jgi:modulator of FtsH protease HflK